MTDTDFKKQYVIQAITFAANNLRLSSEKIEVVTLLRERLATSEDLPAEIQKLKTITEFSKFAVKLGEVYNYISGGVIDFLKVTERFKEHSHSLVRELSTLLDVVTPANFNSLLSKNEEIFYTLKETNDEELDDIALREKKEYAQEENPFAQQDEEKEKFILGDLKTSTEFDFENYLNSVLKPVKSFDAFLERILQGKYTEEELNEYYDVFRQNASLSLEAGLEIVKTMHVNLYEALCLIRDGQLEITKENIDLMRASMIVIVAIVREKDVDISTFLDKAEKLNEILKIRKGKVG